MGALAPHLIARKRRPNPLTEVDVSSSVSQVSRTPPPSLRRATMSLSTPPNGIAPPSPVPSRTAAPQTPLGERVHEGTELLHAWSVGDGQACEGLARLVYDDRRRQAPLALLRGGDCRTL